MTSVVVVRLGVLHVEQGRRAAAHPRVGAGQLRARRPAPVRPWPSPRRCRTGRAASPRTVPCRRAPARRPEARRCSRAPRPDPPPRHGGPARRPPRRPPPPADRRSLPGSSVLGDLLADDRVRLPGELRPPWGCPPPAARRARARAPPGRAPCRPRRPAGAAAMRRPMRDQKPPRVGSVEPGCGTAGQKIQRPKISSSAGKRVSMASSATATPIAATGPRPRVEFISATSSTSMLRTTVAPEARTAGPARFRASAIASCRSSCRRSSSR